MAFATVFVWGELHSGCLSFVRTCYSDEEILQELRHLAFIRSSPGVERKRSWWYKETTKLSLSRGRVKTLGGHWGICLWDLVRLLSFRWWREEGTVLQIFWFKLPRVQTYHIQSIEKLTNTAWKDRSVTNKSHHTRVCSSDLTIMYASVRSMVIFFHI